MSLGDWSKGGFEAAETNFHALMEGLGDSRSPADLSWEWTDANKLQAMTEECETGIFLVIFGGGDVDATIVRKNFTVTGIEEDEEYTHSFVIIKTEEEGLQCFQQNPLGMDSDKEVFNIDADFFDKLGRLTSHHRDGVVLETFQALFCGSVVPAALPPADRMIVKALAF